MSARQREREEFLIKAHAEGIPLDVARLVMGGACVKLVVPSGTTDDWGRSRICVPA